MIFSFMASHLSITFCFIFLLGLGISFLAMFCLPWIRVSSTLAQVTFDIEGLKEKGFDENLDKIFKASGVLENNWNEFKDTLHKQTEIDSSKGQQRVV